MSAGPPRFGLALSGGAACGFGNGGVLEVLDKHELRPDCLTGSSMGAIIGALYAFGIPIDRIHELCHLRLTEVAKLSEAPLQEGLHGGLLRQRLADHLAPILGDARLRDCRTPFTCVAGRVRQPIKWHRIIRSGFTDRLRSAVEPYVFPPETRILDAILASSAIPVIFSPVRIGNEEFVDLVHFGSIPSRTLRETYRPDIVIGTDTNPEYGGLTTLLPSSWREFLAAGYAELEKSRQACDLLIVPHQPYGPHRFDQAEAFWQAGKEAAEGRMEEIRAMIRQSGHLAAG